MNTATRTTDTLATAIDYLDANGVEFRPVHAEAVLVTVGPGVCVRIYSDDREVQLVVAMADASGYPTGEKLSVTSSRPAVIVAAIEAMFEVALELADA